GGHLVVEVLTERGGQRYAMGNPTVVGAAHLGHGVDLDHHMHAFAGYVVLGDGEAVVPGVAAVHEVDAYAGGVGVGLEIEDIRRTKAQYVAVEGGTSIKIGCGQHGVSQSHVAGQETRHALGRYEGLAIGAVAPGQFVAVASRTLHMRCFVALKPEYEVE